MLNFNLNLPTFEHYYSEFIDVFDKLTNEKFIIVHSKFINKPEKLNLIHFTLFFIFFVFFFLFPAIIFSHMHQLVEFVL